MRGFGLLLLLALASATSGCSRSDEGAKPSQNGSGGGADENDAGDGEEGFSCEGSGISKTPWVLAIDKTSAKIRWEACREGTAPEVSIEKEDGGEEKTVTASVSPFEVTETYKAPLAPQGPHDWAGTYYMHEAALTGLTPSSCYRYSLGADASAKGRFCTARNAGDSFKFLVIGDTNPALGDSAAHVLEHNLKANPDFTLHTGDIQYYASLLETWAIWWPKMQPMLAQGGFFPAVGNHEFEKPNEFEQYYTRFFDGAGFSGNTRYFRFQTGGVHFFSLDSEQSLDRDSEQGKWIEAQLADAKSQPDFRFSIVFLHRPWLTCGDTGNQPALREAYEQLFVDNGVKLVLFGHMHGYERFETAGLTYIVSAGGGGHIGNVDENSSRPECEYRKASGNIFNATVMEVSPGKLRGTTTDDQGTVRDEFEIAVP